MKASLAFRINEHMVFVLVVGLALGTISCNQFEKGRSEGYQQGLADGQRQASDRARDEGKSAGIEEGKVAGRAEGEIAGHQRGLAEGLEKGRIEGHEAGRKEGYESGLKDGLAKGREEGRAEAQDAARQEGRVEGEAKGKVEGELIGREAGKQQGYQVGYQQGIRLGHTQEAARIRKQFAFRVGAPIVFAAILIGVLVNASGWRTIASLRDLSKKLATELEIKKELSRSQMKEFVRNRRDNALAAPDVWFIVLTLIAFSVIEYVVSSELSIFLLMTAIALVGAGYAARGNPPLVARLVLFWTVSIALVVDVRYTGQPEWLREAAAIAVVTLSIYFLIRGLFGTGWNRPVLPKQAGTWETGLIVAAALSVTFQIAWILTVFAKFVAPNLLQSSIIGKAFSNVLFNIRSISPSAWFPVGVAAAAILFAAAVRLGRDRFLPTAYTELRPQPQNAIASTLLIIPKLPVWLMLNVFRFLTHYVRQVWETIKHFASNYLARFAYLLAALVFPCVCIIQGHALLSSAAGAIDSHLTNTNLDTAVSLLLVLLQLLVATLLYLFAVAALPIEIESVPLATVPQRIRDYVVNDGAPAALVVGIAYAIFHALLIVSLPVVSLLPGARSRGFFVWLCAAVLGAAMLAFSIGVVRSSRREDTA